MHVGLSYPFADEFWLVEVCFWPNFVPKHFAIESVLGCGTLWDLLNSQLFISESGFSSGNPRGEGTWPVLLPGPAYAQLDFYFVHDDPDKEYRAELYISDGVGHDAFAAAKFTRANGSLWIQDYLVLTHDPPFSIGGCILQCATVPATWSLL